MGASLIQQSIHGATIEKRCYSCALIFTTSLLIVAFSSMVSHAQQSDSVSGLPEQAAAAESLTPVSVGPAFGFDASHVQGLAVTDDFIFFTSVDRQKAAGYIFKLDRKTGKLLLKRNLTRNLSIHPSGIDFDGKYIWVALAVYAERSMATVMSLDPDTLKIVTKFDVKDHIGAVACDGDTVIGANWDAVQFYFWTKSGKSIEKRDSPTGIAYQDCDGMNGFLMCVGGGFLDWIDIKKWKLAKRFEVGKSRTGSSLSREGVAYHDGHVFFLPDDGTDALIYEYKFDSLKNR
jgi:hypothetical protein